MSVVLRLIALVLVVLALMLLGADLVTTLETGKFTTRSLASLWTLIDKTEPQAFLAWSDHHLPPFLSVGLTSALQLWGWAVVGPFGCLLLLLFGRSSGG